MKKIRQFSITVLILTYCFMSSYAQVYVNPHASSDPVNEVLPTAAPIANSGLITQTVYGFLDFTTTIGNTVMIFSPQSAPPPVVSERPKPTNNVQTVVNVIETKPHATEAKAQEIKPSKPTKEVKPKLSSIVHVVAGPNSASATISSSPKIQIVTSQVDVVTSEHNTVHSVLPEKKFVSKVEVKQDVSPIVVRPVVSSLVNNIQSKGIEDLPIYSSVVEVHASSSDETDENEEEEGEEETVLQIANNIGEPEYDFLSRQPSEYAEETYKVINLRSNGQKQRSRPTVSHHATKGTSHHSAKDNHHPTGLVTKLTGTVVKDGATTVHETSVIGTYISGKYAQVLQSSSHVFKSAHKPKISPSSSLRILKTTAPTAPTIKHYVDPSPTGHADTGPNPGDGNNVHAGANHVRASRRPSTSTSSFKNRVQNRANKNNDAIVKEHHNPTSVSTQSGAHSTTKKGRRNKSKTRNFDTPTSVELATVSVYSEISTPSYFSRRNKASRPSGGNFKSSTVSTSSPVSEALSQRRIFKPKMSPVQPSVVQAESEQTSLYKFKLNRAPGRWQYKTSPKPRVTIRKSNGDEAAAPATPPTTNFEVINNDIQSVQSRSDDEDLEQSGSINGPVLNENDTGDHSFEKKYPVETLKVEISTPADFKDTYYEIATIKSPYTFQVGTVKNTRYITVTSTIEKSFEPETSTYTPNPTEPLTENILASTSHLDKEHNLLDSSIATLPVLYLPSDSETPPLETLTETFSTTQEMLKTHILPIVRDGANATSYTLIQTYHITRLVTATKTLPPMDAYQFVPSKRLKEFNSKLDEAGSELHLELEFGDEDNDEDDEPPNRQLPPDLDLTNIGSDFDLFDVDRSKIGEAQAMAKKKAQKPKAEVPMMTQNNLSPELQQQLALLRLLNPAAGGQVITTSKPVIKLETVYESHIVPIINAGSTTYSTISRSIGTVSKTEFEIGTSTLPGLPIPPVPVNPLFPQQQQQFQITTAPIVTQTIVTQTQSKVLKLTFGAKTTYTTLFSTNVVPTLLTTYVTTSVPVQQTAAFPGYFPSPYAPYPFVG